MKVCVSLNGPNHYCVTGEVVAWSQMTMRINGNVFQVPGVLIKDGTTIKCVPLQNEWFTAHIEEVQ